jgi:hypothetical protein
VAVQGEGAAVMLVIGRRCPQVRSGSGCGTLPHQQSTQKLQREAMHALASGQHNVQIIAAL